MKLLLAILLTVTLSASAQPSRIKSASSKAASAQNTPRIINIVNFIRLLEPRDSAITEDVLYQTVVHQLTLMRQYHLRGTFLLQYDALMDLRYQSLLKNLPRDSFDIGAWWEIPQPLVEQAGLPWRGRYPWDWRANIGFSTGYTPTEREKLIDTYMAGFKKIFGYYPASVASWFIDAHSLAYMAEKYGIVASANCKDQYGTDGYTLWGGYWNQAYYPSKGNSYMPAQHAAGQIPVPIFRMLGSDPIRQYDNGLGNTRQGVVTLEPVYAFGGGDSSWIHWFFDVLTQGKDLGFNYTQAGQENSFTWPAMARGLEIQFPLIARLRDEHKVRVETLAESGRWFKKTYPLTPVTSFTVDKDLPGRDGRTIWFDSRFYRLNMLWEKGTLRIRDIHLFDERLGSVYETQPATANECTFFTLPVVDGYLWSRKDTLAGLRLKMIINGKETLAQGGDPIFTPEGRSTMHIRWPLNTGRDTIQFTLTEKQLAIQWLRGKRTEKPIDWYLELTTVPGAQLPFDAIKSKIIEAHFQSIKYTIKAVKGSFSQPANGPVWRLHPQAGAITLDLASNP